MCDGYVSKGRLQIDGKANGKKHFMVGHSIALLLIFLWSVTPSFAGMPSVDAQGRPMPSLAPMLKQVNPAVVNISTYSMQASMYNPLLNDPFFRRFFNLPNPSMPQTKKRQQSAGSGVILDSDKGIIMTNFHVINGADEVQVSLIDGRVFAAEILGTDPDLDIAILSIHAEDLSDVPTADSNILEVGDFVVAIGNPFGLGQTVTTGIVSALGRSGLGIEGYENFIQTDASINPGNSGGALVNLRGELVGINTAIIAPSGGNIGIGFAIPINIAKASMDQIIRYGEVKRGQIGVGIQEITPDLRLAFGLNNGEFGVLVTNVAKGSSAYKAGLLPGDIILEVEGSTTTSIGLFRSQVGMMAIGDYVALSILREGQRQTLRVKVVKPESLSAANGNLHRLLDGVDFENYIENDGEGVLVSAVQINSRAAYSGLRPGDIIVAVNKRRVHNIESLKHSLSRKTASILLQIQRGNDSYYIVLRR